RRRRCSPAGTCDGRFRSEAAVARARARAAYNTWYTVGVDAKLIIEALGPHLGDERREKIDGVAAARLGGLVVGLESLHDPHTGAAALRSCEAIGVGQVHVVGPSFGFSERVTQGCDKWLDLVRHESIDSCAAELKARGFRLYAAVPGAATSLEELDARTPA